jgi:hypothetical protein
MQSCSFVTLLCDTSSPVKEHNSHVRQLRETTRPINEVPLTRVPRSSIMKPGKICIIIPCRHFFRLKSPLKQRCLHTTLTEARVNKRECVLNYRRISSYQPHQRRLLAFLQLSAFFNFNGHLFALGICI